MNSWDNLPNAKHIDWVIDSIKTYPYVWEAVYEKFQQNEIYWEARLEIERNSAAMVYWKEAWKIVACIPSAGRGADGAADALLALVTHDDCAYMIDSDPGEIGILAAFGDQKAVLLLPACTVFHKLRDITPA